MRTVLLALASVVVLGVSALLGARMQADDARVRLRLVDAEDGAGQSGLVRVFRAGSDEPLELAGLLDRLRGVERPGKAAGWYVLPADGADVALPRERLTLEAVSGLETALVRQDLDFRTAAPEAVKVKLPFLFHPERDDLAAGNTHLHLRGLTAEQSDDYLRQIPAADRLKVLFTSYLERHKDDEGYSTNRYPIGDLRQFDVTGVLLNNGEEHRHNFEAFGQGYGHVMFLDLKQLVKPVSLGPGITGSGDDDRPLSLGIAEARGQGGTVIWCHNTNGHEDVLNALAGRLDALNVFDGSRTGTYEDNYYRYLNIGLRLPISTGTDWFVYDFSRVYGRVPGKLTVKSWLEAVKAGRCVATNGPLLTLTVDGEKPGAVLNLERPRTVKVEAAAMGRHDFGRLQLVQNGAVVQSEPPRRDGEGYAAKLVREVRLDGPAWFAVRIDATAKNELGQGLYAHSSPVYVDVAGKGVFDLEAGRGLLRQVEEAQADIRERGKFSSPEAREKLLALYDGAAKELTARMNRRGK